MCVTVFITSKYYFSTGYEVICVYHFYRWVVIFSSRSYVMLIFISLHSYSYGSLCKRGSALVLVSRLKISMVIHVLGTLLRFLEFYEIGK